MAGNNFLSKLHKDAKKVYTPLADNWIAKTSSPAINYLFGKKGGVPAGYSMLLYGPAKAGKSLLSFAYAGHLHQTDPDAIVLHFDTEFRDGGEHWHQAFGIDPERFISYKTNDPKDIFDYIHNDVTAMLQEGAKIKMIIVDSLAAIKYPKEANKESSTNMVIGDAGAYLPGAIKMILPTLRKYKVFTIFAQHVRDNMDPNTAKYRQFVVPGGRGLKHLVEIFCLVTKIEAKDSKVFDHTKKDGAGNVIQSGHSIRVKIEESSISPQNRAVEVDLDYNDGFVNQHQEIAQMAVNMGVVEQAGAWIQYEGKKWNGVTNFSLAIKDDLDLQNKLLEKIKDNDIL